MRGSRAVAVEAARGMLDLSLHRLWIDYIGLGGSLMPGEVRAFLAGERQLSDHDHDMLVQSLNERFQDRGGDHPLDYADELDADRS
jgi:hypothetical protein